MKSLHSKIAILFFFINFNSNLSAEISSKIDFDSDQIDTQPSSNPVTLKAIIDTERGFTQQHIPRGTNFNGRRSSFRPQDGNFVRNSKSFPNRGQGNSGRNNVNSRPVINYIKVFMNGENPNPCEDESCTLTLVKKQLGNGKFLTDVYINIDEMQIDTEGGEVMTIKVTPESDCPLGNCRENPSNVPQFHDDPARLIPGNLPPCRGNPVNFQPGRFYPQRPNFSPQTPHHDPRSSFNPKGIVDDKIGFPLSKTNNNPCKA